MRVERGSPTLWPWGLVNQRWEEPVPEAKPYDIPKRLVWKAYQRVKANRGVAGVDGESLAAFEKDLKGNLYKVWNRMSSGSYFPPPALTAGGCSHPAVLMERECSGESRSCHRRRAPL